MLLLLDNFDSFTYNLVQCFQVLGADVRVLRSSPTSIEECLSLKPDRIVIGPGPGAPHEAGISNQLILAAAGNTPLLGVCLGHQCLAEVYGGKVVRAKKPMHGRTSLIEHDAAGVFKAVKSNFRATRYHSLVVDPESLPSCLKVTAWSDDAEVMGLRHRQHRLESIQFHPESVLTEEGMILLNNFLNL